MSKSRGSRVVTLVLTCAIAAAGPAQTRLACDLTQFGLVDVMNIRVDGKLSWRFMLLGMPATRARSSGDAVIIDYMLGGRRIAGKIAVRI